MRLSSADLAACWIQAASEMPIVIVGGGRWGRVWASVVAEARGTSEGVAVVARTNPDDVRRWARTNERMRHMLVADSISAAFEIMPTSIAIVASRPRDHVGDGVSLLERGCHVLVEKPISDNPASARRLLKKARAVDRLLAVGTEFAFLPAFHFAATLLPPVTAHPRELKLAWTDEPAEIRHGAKKARHEEIHVLEDILPHAVSIFRIFSPGDPFDLIEVDPAPNSVGGRLTVGDRFGGRYQLQCNARSDARRRKLHIRAGQARCEIDFADRPSIHIDGCHIPLPDEQASFSSTLRLELGSFLTDAAGGDINTDKAGIERLIFLHASLGTWLGKAN